MLFKAFAEFDATIGGGLHQMNPAAGRFGFQAKYPVRPDTDSNTVRSAHIDRVQAGPTSRFLDDR